MPLKLFFLPEREGRPGTKNRKKKKVEEQVESLAKKKRTEAIINNFVQRIQQDIGKRRKIMKIFISIHNYFTAQF